MANQRIYISNQLRPAIEHAMHSMVTVVEAPTGYGKSVAVQALCQEANAAVKWVNIYDSNLQNAWNVLCDVFFGDMPSKKTLQRWPFPVDEMAREFFAKEAEKVIGAVNVGREQAYRREPILVLDDFHLVTCERTQHFLDFLRRRFFAEGHLIIISQKQVFEEQEKLIATGKINHIGTRELSLSREDLDSFMHQIGVVMEQEEADLLYAKSEGWISMICVALQNYQRTGKSDVSMDMRYMVDRISYMAFPKEAKELLSYVAFLPDFTKEDADYFAGEDTAELLKEMLSQYSFFDVVAMTGRYHIHTILRECIQYHFDKLSLSDRCKRYERVAAFLLEKGFHQEAMRWYEKAGNYQAVLSTFEKFPTICSREEDRDLMRQVFDACPISMYDDFPGCVVLFMWRFFNYADTQRLARCEEIFQCLLEERVLVPEDKECLWRAYFLFKSQAAFNNLDQMVDYATKARQLKGEEFPLIDRDVPRTFGMLSLMHMFYVGGDPKALADKVAEVFYQFITEGHLVYDGVQNLIYAEYYYFTGRFDEAELECAKALRRLRRNELPEFVLMGLYIKSYIYFVKNDEEKLRDALLEMRQLVVAETKEKTCLMYSVDAAETLAHYYTGYPDHVASWIMEDGPFPEEIMPPATPFFTMVRMHNGMRQQHYLSIIASKELILEVQARYPDNMTLANIYLIFAVCVQGLGRGKEEIKAYVKKATEAIGFELIMVYAKYGEWLLDVYVELAAEDARYAPVVEMARFYAEKAKKPEEDLANGLMQDLILVDNPIAVFPTLTDRENEIAILVMDGKTNKDIATELFISENTVKSALKNIFAKLGISSRRELLRVSQLGSKMGGGVSRG